MHYAGHHILRSGDVKSRIKSTHIGLAASIVLGLIGYYVGAPIEAVLVLVLIGTLIELILFPPKED